MPTPLSFHGDRLVIFAGRHAKGRYTNSSLPAVASSGLSLLGATKRAGYPTSAFTTWRPVARLT